MGRPSFVYRLGETASNYFPRRYEELASAVLETIQELYGTDAIDAVFKMRSTHMIETYRQRRNYFHSGLTKIGLPCPKPEGAFYAFPRVTGAMKAKGMAEDADLVKLLLNEADVVLVPGTPFGAPGYVRLSFACSISLIQD